MFKYVIIILLLGWIIRHGVDPMGWPEGPAIKVKVALTLGAVIVVCLFLSALGREDERNRYRRW